MTEAEASSPHGPVLKVGQRRRAFALYLGTQVSMLGVSTLQALIVMPQMLRSLGQGRYGVWLAFSELLMWLQFCDLGLPNWLIQRCSLSARQNDGEAVGEQMQAVTLIIAAFSCAAALLFAVSTHFLMRRFGANDTLIADFTAPAMVAILAALLLALSNPFVALGRALQVPEILGGTHVFAGGITLIVTWILAVRGYGVWALAGGSLIRGVIVCAGSAWFYRRVAPSFGYRGIRVSRARLRDILGVTPSIAGGSIGYLLSNQAQVSIVATIVAPAIAARFAFTKKLFDLARSLFDAVAAAALGFASDAYADGDTTSRRRVRKLLLSCAIVFSAGATAIAALSQLIVSWWAGRDVFIGNAAAASLAAGTATAGISYVANNVLRGAGRHHEAGNLLMVEGAARSGATYLAATAGTIAGVSGSGIVSGALMLAGVSRGMRGNEGKSDFTAGDVLTVLVICCGIPLAWFLAVSVRPA